jgi:tartrate/fumarate subfamily iron-sulfur-dependent hydro-lyase beta chain
MEREIIGPINEQEIRLLRVGDLLYLTGKVFTARDKTHQLLLKLHEAGEKMPFDTTSMALFHCGPVAKLRNETWQILSAGPTSSIRMEDLTPQFLAAFKTKLIIGKSGMGKKTGLALQEHGAVYAHYTGGAGALSARSFTQVEGVFWLEELGMANAVWIMAAQQFGPLLVTMDSVGGSLYEELNSKIEKNKEAIYKRIGLEIAEPKEAE